MNFYTVLLFSIFSALSPNLLSSIETFLWHCSNDRLKALQEKAFERKNKSLYYTILKVLLGYRYRCRFFATTFFFMCATLTHFKRKINLEGRKKVWLALASYIFFEKKLSPLVNNTFYSQGRKKTFFFSLAAILVNFLSLWPLSTEFEKGGSTYKPLRKAVCQQMLITSILGNWSTEGPFFFLSSFFLKRRKVDSLVWSLCRWSSCRSRQWCHLEEATEVYCGCSIVICMTTRWTRDWLFPWDLITGYWIFGIFFYQQKYIFSLCFLCIKKDFLLNSPSWNLVVPMGTHGITIRSGSIFLQLCQKLTP